MSVNCIRCVKNKRTGFDLLCDQCRDEKLSMVHAQDSANRTGQTGVVLHQGRTIHWFDRTDEAQAFADKAEGPAVLVLPMSRGELCDEIARLSGKPMAARG